MVPALTGRATFWRPWRGFVCECYCTLVKCYVLRSPQAQQEADVPVPFCGQKTDTGTWSACAVLRPALPASPFGLRRTKRASGLGRRSAGEIWGQSLNSECDNGVRAPLVISGVVVGDGGCAKNPVYGALPAEGGFRPGLLALVGRTVACAVPRCAAWG